MRKLTTGNKTNFAIFAIIIIMIIGLIIMFLTKVLNIDKQIYQIDSGTFFYDKNNNPIKLEEEGTLQAKWDGNYYLKDSNKQQYNMGEHVVTFNKKTLNVNTYGKIYQIQIDGKVQEKNGNNKIVNFNEENFYKLEDRKYLITANKIYNDTKTLNTKYYLMVIIDKAGNAFLLNNEINSRVINPMIIKTDTYEFDVANEKLKYQEKEIDLKKVLGSTNLYKENTEQKDIAKEDNTSNQTIIENNNTTNNTNNNNNNSTMNNFNNNTNNNFNNTTNNVINGSESQTGNNNSNSQNNQENQNNQGNQNNQDNKDEENKTELTKSVSLRSVTPTSSTLDVKYNVNDPENKYQTVYLTIDGDIGKNIALDKTTNQYKITGLTPNTEYSIKLMTREISSEGETIETVEDVINVRTNEIQSSLLITEVSLNKIYFNLKLDPNYLFDSANLVLYVDGNKEETIKVNVDSAVSNSGFSGNFKYKYGNVILIRIENAEYNGENVNTDISVKFKNY